MRGFWSVQKAYFGVLVIQIEIVVSTPMISWIILKISFRQCTPHLLPVPNKIFKPSMPLFGVLLWEGPPENLARKVCPRTYWTVPSECLKKFSQAVINFCVCCTTRKTVTNLINIDLLKCLYNFLCSRIHRDMADRSTLSRNCQRLSDRNPLLYLWGKKVTYLTIIIRLFDQGSRGNQLQTIMKRDFGQTKMEQKTNH